MFFQKNVGAARLIDIVYMLRKFIWSESKFHSVLSLRTSSV